MEEFDGVERETSRLSFAVHVGPRRIDFSVEKIHVCPFSPKMAVDGHVRGEARLAQVVN